MAKRIPPATGAVLRFFRFSRSVSEEEFARRAGVAPLTVRRWESGETPLEPEQLIGLLGDHLAVAPEAVHMALLAHRLATGTDEPEGPSELSGAERRLIGRAAAAGGRAATETARRELGLERLRQRAARHTAWAEEAWDQIKTLPARLQDAALQALRGGERSWALAVRLCHASAASAAHRAALALRLARLAVSLSEAAPGSKRWRLLLLGFCELFRANALRVGGSLTAAREAFARADKLWDEGKDGDPAGLLDATRRLDLKASLLRQDGDFAEALNLLDRALAGSPPEAAARLMIQKATTYRRAGNYQLAAEVLKQAEPRIDREREPRLVYGYYFSLALNYCHLDRYDDAEVLLPLIETLASDLHTELDGIRTVWLKGRVHAGIGRREEGVASLSQVRRYLFSKEIAYDFALVSLELATLYLDQGHARVAKELAEEMLWIFERQEVHREALAALALFCQAAQVEEAEADRTRLLIKFLYRAQYNASLHFEP
jgi:transcriptional regulator with XRE-family HTH domain/Tfp pilus assembly protein PilF